MKTVSKLWPALLLLSSVASAQQISQVTVSISLANPTGLDAFFLKDFDITRPGTGPDVFFVQINNANLVDYPNLVMELSVESRRNGNLSRGRTNAFTLAGTERRLQISNRRLFNNSGRFAFDQYRFDEDLLDDLIRDILSTGRLPTDVYTFRVRIFEANDETNSTIPDQVDLRISNPRKLDLVFPGSPASGRKSDCLVVFTNLPQFRWESDLRIFRVIIAEARQGEDPEGVLNQQPRFARNFIVQNSRTATRIDIRDLSDFPGRTESIPATTFQFPSSGEILRLEPGKVYYWRVIGISETSSGRVQLPSEIYCFRIAKLEDVGGKAQQMELVLRNLLGGEYDKIFGRGGELENYKAVRATFEGKEVTLPDLLPRLPKLSRRFAGYSIE